MRAPELKNESYEPKKLEAMYNNLLTLQKNGQPREYEVRVDDFPVIERNNDPERFMGYADFISPETKYVSVLLYRNNNQSDKYFFHLRPNQFTQGNSLSGLSMSGIPTELEQQHKERLRKELHYEELIKENETLKSRLEQYEDTIEAIEDEKEQIRSNRDMGFEKIAGILLSGALKTDFVKKNFPIVGQLSGTQENEEQTPEQEPATFKRKGQVVEETRQPEEKQTESITEEERAYIRFVQDIRSRVGDMELSSVMHLLDLVTSNPFAITFAIKSVSNYIKQKNEKV